MVRANTESPGFAVVTFVDSQDLFSKDGVCWQGLVWHGWASQRPYAGQKGKDKRVWKAGWNGKRFYNMEERDNMGDQTQTRVMKMKSRDWRLVTSPLSQRSAGSNMEIGRGKKAI